MAACEQPAGLLETLLEQHEQEFAEVIQGIDDYQVQIYYTQINRNVDNQPFFSSYSYNVDENRYFYPASTVKLPIVLLTLEYLNELNINGLDMHTPMFTDRVHHWQSAALVDSTSESGVPSVAHYIKRILLVSDNEAYNRLYELLGQDYIHQKLQEKGYRNTIIVHRLEQFLDETQNKTCNPIRFEKEGKLIFRKNETIAMGDYCTKTPIVLGKGELLGNEVIGGGKDFSKKNRFPIKEMQLMLRSIFFPESVPYYQRFNLTAQQLNYVRKWMGALPNESKYPTYDTTQYFESYVKFFMYGDSRQHIPSHIRIFNKIGDAYGFLIDNAYVVDYQNGIEFLLTACIYTNENRIFNDNHYEYETIGFPFMANLGKMIYQYEKERTKEYYPNFAHLDFYKQN
ncbi:MAG: serine hydrolase [Flammeovirgaceae bacterium]